MFLRQPNENEANPELPPTEESFGVLRPTEPVETLPLDNALPMAPNGSHVFAAQTVLARGDSGVVDVVLPHEKTAVAWTAYARPRHSNEWTSCRVTPDEHGRYFFDLPDARVFTWGFRRQTRGVAANEHIWRVFARNVLEPNRGDDICLRLVVCTEPEVHRAVRALPRRIAPRRAAVKPAKSRRPWDPAPIYDALRLPALSGELARVG